MPTFRIVEALLIMTLTNLRIGPCSTMNFRCKQQTLTWIEIAVDRAITVSALPAPDFATPLPEDSLPATLGEGAFRLTRKLARPD